ncbi:unannotated protein [freshwater metagenome]|uniref:Unannotated protein n=1 Tax=freshwater metagenome TaxID=449393 RepID=A0A6J6G4T5_9ZZZZ
MLAFLEAKPATLSLSSRTNRWAPFFPNPGKDSRVFKLLDEIAVAIVAESEPDKIACATFGPIPVTERSNSKKSLSIRSVKPNKINASSRTTRYV